MTGRRPIYPIDAWLIRETAFDPRMAARNETIFALGNGHLGMRGNLEEEAGNRVHGTYVNGFFEETPIAYGEGAHGYPKNHQILLNVADGKRIQLYVDSQPFDLSTGTTEAYERSLDLRQGVLTRIVRWRSPGGALVELTVRRLVSLTRRPIAAIHYEVALLEGEVPLRIVSSIDGDVRNQPRTDDPRIGTHLPDRALFTIRSEVADGWGAILQKTATTGFTLAAAMDHDIDAASSCAAPTRIEAVTSTDRVSLIVDVDAGSGSRVALTKYLAYCPSLDAPDTDLIQRARAAIADARALGFAGLVAEQRAALARFWAISDVEIDGDAAIQQGVRFNLFSLLQAADDGGRTSLAAKGLTGEGYEGHYFWDTEIFALPFFIYTQPQIARALLRYRCGILDAARARAAEMSQRGALYPWRTIGGEEASAYFPAGTAQYHINADIAHAVAQYVSATGDRSLLREGAAEMVFETARLWADLGDYVPSQGGQFCINEVTGPDEYTALVNNNCYTNLMARAHLRYAANLASELAAETPQEYRRLAARIDLTEAEIAAWRKAADLMRVPRDESLGIHAQDDCFLTRAVWDFANTPRSKYPLLLHYHPLVIYRHQVLKQPDVVLAQVLLPRDFSMAEKKRNFDYYDPLTTGDSSLSPCIQSVAAAELGYETKAYRYFLETARMDLDDVNGNVADGVHLAAMAGSWVSLVYGFAGFRDDGGRLSFAPRLPTAWRRLAFRLLVRGSLLAVSLSGRQATYHLLDGDPLEVLHFGHPLRVGPDAPVTAGLVPEPECVIFDLDGVITDTAEHHFRAWQRLASEIALPFDRELNERLKGVSRMESLEIILENAGQTASLKDKVRLAERKNAYFRELIEAITPRDLLPGIAELLGSLRAHGIKTAIASMSHNVWDVVRRLEIEPLVDLIVDPTRLVKGKPDPEIFLTAAEQLGVRFENCIGVEDARAGIQAIKEAGMVAVGVGSDLPEADWLVPESRQLTYEGLVDHFHAASPGRRTARH